MTADLVVIGGGPLGLATALYADRAGLSVRVLEPRAGVVDKACGEGLMPGALTALQALGVDPPGRVLAGIRYTDGQRWATAEFPRGPGRGVRRTTLHGCLLEAAERAGVEVVTGAMEQIDQDESGVSVRIAGRATALRGSYAVAADGLHSPTRRALGLQGPARGRRRHGIRQHFRLTPWSGHVEVHWAERAEAYVTPVADDLVGVAVLTGARGSLEDHLAAFPQLVDRLAGATPASSPRGAGPLRQRVTSRVAGRVLLVGDAGGYVDALTGEGLAVGLAQAQVAVRALASGRPDRYPRWAHAVSWRGTALTAGLLAATGPTWARRRLLPATAALPWLFHRAVDELAHPGPGVAPARPSVDRG